MVEHAAAIDVVEGSRYKVVEIEDGTPYKIDIPETAGPALLAKPAPVLLT